MFACYKIHLCSYYKYNDIKANSSSFLQPPLHKLLNLRDEFCAYDALCVADGGGGVAEEEVCGVDL